MGKEYFIFSLGKYSKRQKVSIDNYLSEVSNKATINFILKNVEYLLHGGIPSEYERVIDAIKPLNKFNETRVAEIPQPETPTPERQTSERPQHETKEGAYKLSFCGTGVVVPGKDEGNMTSEKMVESLSNWFSVRKAKSLCNAFKLAIDMQYSHCAISTKGVFNRFHGGYQMHNTILNKLVTIPDDGAGDDGSGDDKIIQTWDFPDFSKPNSETASKAEDPKSSAITTTNQIGLYQQNIDLIFSKLLISISMTNLFSYIYIFDKEIFRICALEEPLRATISNIKTLCEFEYFEKLNKQFSQKNTTLFNKGFFNGLSNGTTGTEHGLKGQTIFKMIKLYYENFLKHSNSTILSGNDAENKLHQSVIANNTILDMRGKLKTIYFNCNEIITQIANDDLQDLNSLAVKAQTLLAKSFGKDNVSDVDFIPDVEEVDGGGWFKENVTNPLKRAINRGKGDNVDTSSGVGESIGDNQTPKEPDKEQALKKLKRAVRKVTEDNRGTSGEVTDPTGKGEAAFVGVVGQVIALKTESVENLKTLGDNYTKLCEKLQIYTKVLAPFSFNIMDFTSQTTANIYKNEDGSEIFSRGKDQVTLNIAKNSHNSDYVNFLNMAIDCAFYIHEIDIITTNHSMEYPKEDMTNWQKLRKIVFYSLGFFGATAAVMWAGPAGAVVIGIVSGALKVVGVIADQIGGVSDGDATEEREAFIGQASHLGHSVSDMLASVGIFLAAIAHDHAAYAGGGLKKYIKAARKAKKSSRRNVRKTRKRIVKRTSRKRLNKYTKRRNVRRTSMKYKRRISKKSSRKNRTRRKNRSRHN